MKPRVFNFKRRGMALIGAIGGAIGGAFIGGAFIGGASLVGTLPAAEPLPLPDLTGAPWTAPKIQGTSTGTNRTAASIGDPTRSLPKRPEELNIDDWRRRRMPLAMPSSRPGVEDKDKGLLDDQSTWGYITPQDIIDDYMARNILKMPEYGPDGKKRNPASAVDHFLQQVGRGIGQTNEAAGYSLFGLRKLTNARQSEDVSEDDSDSSNTAGFRRTPFGLPPAQDFNRNLLSTRSDDYMDSSDGKKDVGLTPEAVRMRKAQQEHLESFKKVWSFDEPEAPDVANTPSRSWLNPAASFIPQATAVPARPSSLGDFSSPAPLAGTTFGASPVPSLPDFSSLPGSSPSSASTLPPSMSPAAASREAVRVMMNKPSNYSVPTRKF